MFTFYMICAVVGCTVLIVQLIMMVVGAGMDDFDLGGDDFDAGGLDGDVPSDDPGSMVDHGSSFMFGVLSFRALVAALGFFGLGGLAALEAGLSNYFTFVVACVLGAGAMFLVAWLMQMLFRLRSEGNVHIARAVGETGRVYLTIPASNSGAGKVTVTVQERTMELPAVTAGESLPTGATVTVTGLHGGGTLKVEAVHE
jgi:hypothetical protein